MNRSEFARWLAGVKPGPHRIVAVDENGGESPISFRAKGAHRWVQVANVIFNQQARGCRLFDTTGALIDQCDLDDEDGPSTPPDFVPLQATQGGFASAAEVSRIVEVTANAVVRAVERASQAQAQASKAGFDQLCEVVKVLTTRVKELETDAQATIEQQREDLEEKREEEKSDGKMEAMVMRLIEKAGPDQLKGFMGLLNGSAAKPDAKEQ